MTQISISQTNSIRHLIKNHFRMKQILIILFLIVISKTGNSQEIAYKVPDYDLIKKEIQNSTSSFYYPKLLSRLIQYDTTLTDEDFRYLYYGYIYQPKYQPYWISPYEKKLLKYYQSEKIKEKDYAEIIELATKSIDEFPFDLRQMNFLAYVYHLKGDEATAKKIEYRLQRTLGAIVSTGDGKTCATAFHVISVSHEYVILNLFQFQEESQSLSSDYCDYLTVKKDERNIDGIYFNVKKLFDTTMDLKKNK